MIPGANATAMAKRSENTTLHVSILCEPSLIRILPFFQRLLTLSNESNDLHAAIIPLRRLGVAMTKQLTTTNNTNQNSHDAEQQQSLMYISNRYSNVFDFVNDISQLISDKLILMSVDSIKRLMEDVNDAIQSLQHKLQAADCNSHDNLPNENACMAADDSALEINADSQARSFDRDDAAVVSAPVDADDNVINDEDNQDDGNNLLEDNDAEEEEADETSVNVEDDVANLSDEALLLTYLKYHATFNSAVYAECELLMADDAASSENDDGFGGESTVNTPVKKKPWEKQPCQKEWDAFFRDIPAEKLDVARLDLASKWQPLTEAEVDADIKKSSVLRDGIPKKRTQPDTAAAVKRRNKQAAGNNDDDNSDGEAREFNAAVVVNRTGGAPRESSSTPRVSKGLRGCHATGRDSDGGDDGSSSDGDDSDVTGSCQRKKSKKRPRLPSSGTNSDDDDSDNDADGKKAKKSKAREKKKKDAASSGSECEFLEERPGNSALSQKTPSPKKSQPQQQEADDAKKKEKADGGGSDDDLEVLEEFHQSRGGLGNHHSHRRKQRYQTKTKKRSFSKKFAGLDAASRRIMRESRKHSKQMSEKRKRIIEKFGDDSGVLDLVVEDQAATTSSSTPGATASQNASPSVTVDPGLWACLKRHQKSGVVFMYDAVVGTIDVPDSTTRDSMVGCILAHQMGLGKTLQSFTIADTFYHDTDIPVRKILVLTPLNNRDNWENEIKMWSMKCTRCTGGDPLKFQSIKGSTVEHLAPLLYWTEGVIIMHYNLFRTLFKLFPGVGNDETNTGVAAKTHKVFAGRPDLRLMLKSKLLDGPDLVILDEAHALKGENTQSYRCVAAISTPAKIALTGTPLQNNLLEYYALIQLLRKGQLLKTKKKFEHRFVRPIERGKTADATSKQVSEMKKKSHVLYQMLRDVINFRDWTCISADEKPRKYEHIITVRLSPIQEALYKKYAGVAADFVETVDDNEEADENDQLQNVNNLVPDLADNNERKCFLRCQKFLQRICVHPQCEVEAARRTTMTPVKQQPPGAASTTQQEPSSSVRQKFSAEIRRMLAEAAAAKQPLKHVSTKMHIAREIITFSLQKGDKVLVFSQSLDVLDYMQTMLRSGVMPSIKNNNNNNGAENSAAAAAAGRSPNAFSFFGASTATSSNATNGDNSGGNERWEHGRQFDRIDGGTDAETRTKIMNRFNQQNSSVKVLLLSVRACSLGVNLVGANRAIVLDTDWNPSYDMQAVHRIYRFGQTKPCYIYRLISAGTIEEKIYRRQNFKLSLHKRVLQDQQSDRNFRETLTHTQLIAYEPSTNPMTVNLKPVNFNSSDHISADKLLQKLVNEDRSILADISAHDTLLLNRNEPELTDEEKTLAYMEDEAEEKGKNIEDLLSRLESGVADSMLVAGSTSGKKYSDFGFSISDFRSRQTLMKTMCERIVDDKTNAGNREAFAKELVSDLISAVTAHDINEAAQRARSMVSEQQQRLAHHQQYIAQIQQQQQRQQQQQQQNLLAPGRSLTATAMSQLGKIATTAFGALMNSVTSNNGDNSTSDAVPESNLSFFAPQSHEYSTPQFSPHTTKKPSSSSSSVKSMPPATAVTTQSNTAISRTTTAAAAVPKPPPIVITIVSPFGTMTVAEALKADCLYVIGTLRANKKCEVGNAQQLVERYAHSKLSELDTMKTFKFIAFTSNGLENIDLQLSMILYTTPYAVIRKKEIDSLVMQIGVDVERVRYTKRGQVVVKYFDGRQDSSQCILSLRPDAAKKGFTNGEDKTSGNAQWLYRQQQSNASGRTQAPRPSNNSSVSGTAAHHHYGPSAFDEADGDVVKLKPYYLNGAGMLPLDAQQEHSQRASSSASVRSAASHSSVRAPPINAAAPIVSSGSRRDVVTITPQMIQSFNLRIDNGSLRKHQNHAHHEVFSLYAQSSALKNEPVVASKGASRNDTGSVVSGHTAAAAAAAKRAFFSNNNDDAVHKIPNVPATSTSKLLNLPNPRIQRFPAVNTNASSSETANTTTHDDDVVALGEIPRRSTVAKNNHAGMFSSSNAPGIRRHASLRSSTHSKKPVSSTMAGFPKPNGGSFFGPQQLQKRQRMSSDAESPRPRTPTRPGVKQQKHHQQHQHRSPKRNVQTSVVRNSPTNLGLPRSVDFKHPKFDVKTLKQAHLSTQFSRNNPKSPKRRSSIDDDSDKMTQPPARPNNSNKLLDGRVGQHQQQQQSRGPDRRQTKGIDRLLSSQFAF